MFAKHYNWADIKKDLGVPDMERSQLDEKLDPPLATDTSVSNKSRGYIEHDTFKTPESMVRIHP